MIFLQIMEICPFADFFTHLGNTRVLLVCGLGLTGSDKTESAVPGRCK